jgi:hypothetical protein
MVDNKFEVSANIGRNQAPNNTFESKTLEKVPSIQKLGIQGRGSSEDDSDGTNRKNNQNQTTMTFFSKTHSSNTLNAFNPSFKKSEVIFRRDSTDHPISEISK